LAIEHQNETVAMDVIATVESPYKEKFAIPRQPGIVTCAKGKVMFLPEYNHADIVRDIAQFSHIWVLFIFHQTQDRGWKALVRPPRLGGNAKTGVLSTRSTFRPNPIGMSVVKLDSVSLTKGGGVTLEISGLDLIDGTPVIDIKPYIPYCDAILNAQAGFAQNSPETELRVHYGQSVKQQLQIIEEKHPDFSTLLSQVLSQDPRPAYKKNKPDSKVYGMALYQYNIEWHLIEENTIEIISIK
jgi:tRNA-Thr(GGU) m(6)t(6)A37 methyltransferase TsaA